MAATYKTPGVYIQEISKFPPSVAQVETAIPAFIGYTQKAVIKGIDQYAPKKAAADGGSATGSASDQSPDLATAVGDAKTALDKASGDNAEAADITDAQAKLATVQTALNTAANNKASEQTIKNAQTTLAAAAEALTDNQISEEDKAKLTDAKADLDKLLGEASAPTAPTSSTNENLAPIVLRITSLLEYELLFGGPELATDITVVAKEGGDVSVTVGKPSKHVMYYSLQAFFANGGGPCYIVSVGKTAGEGTFEQPALEKGVKAIEKEDEVTLIVIPESLSLGVAESKALHDEALKQCAKLQDRFVVMDADLNKKNADTGLVDIVSAAADFRNDGIGNGNLKYGAAYGPLIETIFDYAYDEKAVDVTIEFTQPDESGNIPEPATSTMHAINPNPEMPPGETSPPQTSPYGQYYPLVKSAIASVPVVLPAAPLVVGIYADVDSTRGVWKAPANVSLRSVIGPTIKISSDEQATLNIDTTGKSINAIRAFAGKGTLIWGARTLAGNDNEWRYVPVRRFFNMAEESIKKATEGFVFEPNDSNTWTKIKAMIENFLTLQWRAGALQGAKPEQSFYVKVGLNETMTALDILEGRLIVEIGMAVVRPAEFIILKFSHKMAES